MKTVRIFLKAVLALLLMLACSAPAWSAGLSAAEYREKLKEFHARVDELYQHPEDAAKFKADIPDELSVVEGSQAYSISFTWMKDYLKHFSEAAPEKRSDFLKAIQKRLEIFEEQFQLFESRSAATEADRKKLTEILERREFRAAKGPSIWSIWWERIERWISDFFSRHGGGRITINLLHLVIYLMVAFALSVFAIWLKRRLGGPRGVEATATVVAFSPSSKGWKAWLAEARAAAQHGDWRNGIHLAYWAGISFLEENGAWKPDRARTPREYLRLLSTRNARYPALSKLTGKFEVVWYGNRDASAVDFQETLGQLESLGCK